MDCLTRVKQSTHIVALMSVYNRFLLVEKALFEDFMDGAVIEDYNVETLMHRVEPLAIRRVDVVLGHVNRTLSYLMGNKPECFFFSSLLRLKFGDFDRTRIKSGRSNPYVLMVSLAHRRNLVKG